MGQLSRESRTALIAALEGLPFTDTNEGRNLLLSGLPPRLRALIPRSDSQYTDLSNMVDTAADWSAPTVQDTPLLLLVDNAIGPVEGSQQAETLKALRARIAQELAAPSISLAAVRPNQRRAIALGAGALGLILLVGLVAWFNPPKPPVSISITPTIPTGPSSEPTPTHLPVLPTNTAAPLSATLIPSTLSPILATTPEPPTTIPAPPTSTSVALTSTPEPPTAIAEPAVWQQVLSGGNVKDLIGVAGQDNALYASGFDLYHSTDDGLSWRTLHTQFFFKEVRVAASNPLLIYGASAPFSDPDGPGELYRSEDGGKAWTLIPMTEFPFEVDVTNPAHLFGLDKAGAHQSSDSGQTWTTQQSASGSSSHSYPGAFLVRGLSDKGKTMYALYASVTGTVFMQRSSNSGTTWSNVHGAIDTLRVPRDLVVDPQDAQHLYYVGGQGVFFSTDGATTWQAHNTGLAAAPATPSSYDVTSLARNLAGAATEPLFLGTSTGGVFRYNHDGETWEPFAPAPSGQSIQRLLVTNSPSGQGLLAATPDGIYRWPLR